MKPRLEPCEEAPEDVLVWLKLSSRMHARDRTNTPVRFRCLCLRSLCSDRRDAELMSWAQCDGRFIRTQYGLSHYGGPLGLWQIDLGGQLWGALP